MSNELVGEVTARHSYLQSYPGMGHTTGTRIAWDSSQELGYHSHGDRVWVIATSLTRTPEERTNAFDSEKHCSLLTLQGKATDLVLNRKQLFILALRCFLWIASLGGSRVHSAPLRRVTVFCVRQPLARSSPQAANRKVYDFLKRCRTWFRRLKK